jgi:CheY-like chemotaxis protein
MPPPADEQPIPILIAEDSQYDRMILAEAFEQLNLAVTLTFVTDGEEVLDYLRGITAALGVRPSAMILPALVLMDLNMPRMGGLDTLKAMRADLILRALPVIVLTTSDEPRQVALAYANGVNSFLTKPWRFEDLVALLDSFGAFWLRASKLPDIAAIV